MPRFWLTALLPLLLGAAEATAFAPAPLATVQTHSLGAGPLALSPDGRTLAVLDAQVRDPRKPTLALYDVSGGEPRELWRVPASDTWRSGLTFTPDGKSLVQLGGSLRVYDVATGKQRWDRTEDRQHSPQFMALAQSADGSAAYVSSLLNWQPHLTRLDLGTGETVWDAFADAPMKPDWQIIYNRVTALALNPAGDVLATGSFGGGLVLRWASDGAVVKMLTDVPVGKRATEAAKAGQTAHGGQVLGLAFLSDGTLLSGANDGTLKRWNVTTGERLALALVPGGVQGFQVQGQDVYTRAGAQVSQFSLPDLQKRRSFGGHTDELYSFGLGKDTFWTASEDGTVKRWNLKTGEVGETYGQVKVAAVSPDGQTFALGLGDTDVRLTDARGQTRRILHGVFATPKTGEYVGSRSLAFSPDGNILAAGQVNKFHMTVESYTTDSAASLWKVGTGQRLRTLAGMPAEHLTFGPGGKALLGLSLQDGSVDRYGLRRTEDGAVLAKPCRPYTPKGDPVSSCPAETVLGAGWVGQRARVVTLPQNLPQGQPQPAASVRDLHTGKTLFALQGQVNPDGPALGLSPDGKRVVSLAGAGLRVWDGAGKLLSTNRQELNAQPYWNNQLIFSPDSRFFVVPDVQMNPPRLYSGATGQVLTKLNEKATALGFVRGGRALVTLGEGGVKVWEVR